MPVFDESFYREGNKLKQQSACDYDGYKQELANALDRCVTLNLQASLLKAEAVEITRHVTDAIRDLVLTDKRIRRLVLDEGAIPLTTWSEALDSLAERSLPELKGRIAEMANDLEHGHIQGFPATMFLYGKPTFTTLEGFYKIVFDLASNLH